MANRFTDPRSQFLDATPAVYSGGLLYFYLTGTTTATDSYSNSTLTTPNTNPVVLDSAGRLPNDVFLDPNVTYKVVLKTSAGVTVWTADPVVDPAANVTAAFQVYSGNPNGNVAGSQGSVGGTSASVVWDITNSLLYVCTTTGTATTAVWTQVASTLTGGVQMTGDISPTSLAADQDNYSPTGNTGASVIRQDCSANVILTGLAGGSDGFLKTIVNISTANTITLADGAIITTSTAANRFAFGGNNHILYPNQSIDLIYDSTTSRWRQKGNQPMLPVPWPGGRLTLTTAVPVLTSDVTAATTVYYTPYLHGFVPLYNGTNWYIAPFSEMSQTLADATKSPAAAAVSSVYDLFVWNDAGTLRCTRGPAWTSATARGTGAATTELERINGIWMNKVTITNGPAANRGTYVGTIATSASGANGELNMMLAPTWATGVSNRLDVWNMYNRVSVSSMVRDTTNSWTYSTTTWRSANNNAANRVIAVFGFSEDAVQVSVNVGTTHSASGNSSVGIGVDVTNAFSGFPATTFANTANVNDTCHAEYSGPPGLGSHFFQWIEYSGGATSTFFGDDGAPTLTQSGMIFTARM